MPTLPEGVRERKRADGRAELVANQRDGEEYVVRTCDGPEVTHEDVDDLIDTEKVRPREFVDTFKRHSSERWREYENQMLDDYTEAALPVARAGLGVRSFGWSRGYARGWDRIFNRKKESR